MKKIILDLVFVSLICFTQSGLHGQKILYPEAFPVNTRIDNFLTMDGEANETTLSLMFDRKGFLWSGTETGLYRFDGVRYVEYRNIALDSTGFAGSMVYTILEDSAGIIWVGTMGALNRLDNRTGRFTRFYPDPEGKFPSNNVIRVIKEGRDSKLWIKTYGNIYSFDKKTSSFTEYKIPAVTWKEPIDLPGDEPERFLIDRAGNIWAGTDRGLYCIDYSENKLRIILPPGDNAVQKSDLIRYVSEDFSGNIWCGTAAGELFRISPSDWIPKKINFDPGGEYRKYFHLVSSMLHEKDGTIWLFGNKSFMHFDPATGKKKTWIINFDNIKGIPSILNYFIVNNAFFHPDSSIWMCSRANGAVIRFERNTEKLSFYLLPFYVEFRYLMDNSGSIWVGSVRNNVFRLSTDLMPYSTINVNNVVRTVATAGRKIDTGPDNHILAALTTGVYMIQINDPYSSPLVQELNVPGTDTTFSSVLTDTRKRLWLGENNGNIIRFNTSAGTSKKYRLEHSSLNISDKRIPVLEEDAEGNIWAVMTYTGLYRYDESSDRFLHILDFGKYVKQSSTFSDLLVSKNGEIWILFLDRLLRLDPGSYMVKDYSSVSYINNIMYGYYGRIREDINGNIWLVNCHNGLYKFDRDNDSFIHFTSTGIKPGLTYFDLNTDSLCRLWIAHSEGISVLDPARGISRLIRTGKIQYDCQGYEVPGHMVYINGREIYVFKHEIPVNKTEPPVYLIKLEINGQSYDKVVQTTDEIRDLKELNLRHNQNSLRIEFTAINYLDAKNNTYFYFMKGVDDDTVSSGTINFAEYKKIKPGRYTFWVTAANNDGIINKTGTSLNINIKTPYYKSTLAYILYSALFLSLVFGYIRLRLRSIKLENIRLEKEVSQRTAELSIKNRQLEDVDRMKTKFFTDISHEIRTPLSLILGPLETLTNENHYEPVTESLLEIMKRNSQRLMQLVTQMLDISRLDSGRMKIVLSESDLTVFLRLLVYEYVSLAESKKIKYVVELPEKPHKVLFDEDKLEKIITNLLSNAFKYTESGGTVRCSAGLIPGGFNGISDLFVFSVADTGEGIETSNIDRIFERYYRVEDEGGNIHDGTGIGLSLVKELVTLCHGTISVKSRKGEGSLFEVSIPLGKEHLSPDEFVIASGRTEIKESREIPLWKDIRPVTSFFDQDHERQRLILIEDNDDLRNYLSANLEKDYSVISAENGREGLNLCLTLMPDLVVTDIMMKDVDGIELCNKIKNDERTSHIPVIMLTARSTTNDKIEGLKAGADDYIVKPFSLAELKTRISNLLLQREKLKNKYTGFLNVEMKDHEMQSVDDRFMRKVISIINENIQDFDFNVTVLMEKLGMSRTHLFRKLKVLTGMSPVMLIRKMRMEKAARMLLIKSGNITEISFSVGISNPSYFTRCFREHFGMNPREYMAANGKIWHK